MAVHIEELYIAFLRLHKGLTEAMVDKEGEDIEAGKDAYYEFMKFCREHELHVDFDDPP
jgi:hypothetical protein